MRRIETDYIKHKDEILTFNRKQYSNVYDHLDEYLSYRFEKNTGTDFSLFAMQDEKIAGQIIMLKSKIRIGGEETDFYWGTDFIVDKKHRGQKIGLELLKALQQKNHLIYGLNKNSLPIVLALGENVIGHYSKFVCLNPAFAVNHIAGKFNRSSGYVFPVALTYKTHEFSLSQSPDFRKTGFNPCNAVQTIRSGSFLKWRFFYKPGKYFVYYDRADDGLTYFAVRVIDFKKMKMLLLVDFRFKDDSDETFKKVTGAVKKLSKKLKLCGIVTMSSYQPFCEFLKKNLFYSYQKGEIVSNFITGKNISGSGGLMVTLADSDGDFYFSNNPWSFS